MAIGSVGVEVVPDARGFWRRFQEQTRGDSFGAGAESGRDFMRGFKSSTRGDVDINVRADTARARAEIASLRNEAKRGSGSIIADLLALSPALIPVTAAVAAAGAEFAALAGTAALALGGIKREMQALSPVGVQFASVTVGLKQSLFQLEAVASRGVLTGVQDSVAQLRNEMPALTQVVASQSSILGSVISNLTTGLIGGFTTFEPVLNRVGASVETLSQRFAVFATGPGGAKFAQTLIDSFNQVVPVLSDLGSAFGHIISASAGFGSIILTEFGAIARAISSIPTPVLTAFITALAAARIGMLAFRGAAAIQGVITGVGGALDALRARFALSGLQAEAAAAQQAAASATIAGAVAAEAQFVAEAKVTEAQALLATQLAAAEAAAGVSAAALAEAEAVVAATRAEIVSLQQSAAIATETALTKAGAAAAAADAQVAAAAAAATAQRTASAGFASMLGPLGLVAGGLLLLPALFGGAGDGAEQAAASTRDYTQALVESNGAINDSVRSKIADSFSGQQDAIKGAGLTLNELINAVTKGGTAYEAAKTKVRTYNDALNAKKDVIAAAGARDLSKALLEQRDRFRDGQAGALELQGAVSGLGTTMEGIAVSAARGGTAFNGFADAVNEFLKSSDTAADRGKLIGETLRAANGDAISYQNTINATAKANQQLVTDFVNLKKGVLDLKTGTLDYHNAAAGPVLSDLQALQDANVKAAAAVYQHFVSTKGGAEAATNAFEVYKKNTQGALDTIGKKLGLSGDALKNFKNEYFGIKNAGELKKNIQLIGQDRVVDALKGIARLLQTLVGSIPLITISADGRPAVNTIAGLQRTIDAIRQNQVPELHAGTNEAAAKIRELQGYIDNLHGKNVRIVTTVVKNGATQSVNIGGGNNKGGVTANAAGGYISGPGTGTSDSIPALLSNGEFVINAAQTKKHRGLLQSINSGVRGFASGGEVGGYTGVDYSGNAGNGAKRSSGKSSGGGGGKGGADVTYKLVGFELDGQTYKSSKDARKAAEKALRAQASLSLKVRGSELSALKLSLKKTASDVRDAFSTIYDDLKKLGLKGGSPLAKQLINESKVLASQVNARNKAADKLADVTQKYRDLAESAKQAVAGSFDITSAGKGFDGQQPVTGLNILAQQKQALTRVRAFVADIKKLRGKINGTYLRQLIEQGPDALPQAEALLTLDASQLRELNGAQSAIASQGQQLGQFAGETFYRADLNKLDKQVDNLNRTISRLGAGLSRDITRTANALGSRPVLLYANGREIARIVDQEHAKKKRRS